MQMAGMRLKKEKCRFMLTEVEYLGHKISCRGLQPSEEKVRAVQQAPTPTSLTQLKSFLGLVNYYSRFLPNLATTLAPLYKLLQKQSSWSWGPDQQRAFQEAKKMLSSSSLLVHYSAQRELILSCDASPYGVGAVLSHRMEDGSEKPVAFASRSLSPAEKRYSQLDKEALAIIFGVTRFRQYLLGRQFTICSDHKPLMHLFGELRGVPAVASARIQRWALTLSAYNYRIEYKPGKDLSNADGLSRLPLPEVPTDTPLPGDTVLLLECIQTSPIRIAQLRRWTSRDPLLAKVLRYVMQGWPSTTGDMDDDLLPYSRRRDELSVQDGCLLWGNRVIIPPPGRESILSLLHETHPGISRIKSLARSYVWWPGMDAALETKVRSCNQCQENQKSPSKAPLHPWDWPERPWARVHADFAGPFMGKLFLLLVDAHSKWLEVHIVPSTTTHAAVEKLRLVFATHGLPEVLVTDNGPAFTSAEFSNFTKRNGIRHLTTSPYHPSANGLAERAVQTFKQAMKRSAGSGPLDVRISNFLLTYRLTPHSTTGRSPAELLMSRQPRSVFDLLRPNISETVRRSQERQKIHNPHSQHRVFNVDDSVWARSFSSGPRWLKGRVTESRGPVTYRVQLQDGRSVRRHVDHLKSNHVPATVSESPVSPVSTSEPDYFDIPSPSTVAEPETVVQATTTLRRSQRNRRPPEWFSPFIGGGYVTM